MGHVGGPGAGGTGLLGAGIDHPLVSVVEPPAGGASQAAGDPAQIAAVDVDGVLLVAGRVANVALENQPLAISREIRLGVLAVEGELREGAKKLLRSVGGPRSE